MRTCGARSPGGWRAPPDWPYTADHVLMTVGSSGAINTVLKAILDPGDEVIVLAPYFPEYRFYIENHAGRVVQVETGPRLSAGHRADRAGTDAAHPRHHI